MREFCCYLDRYPLRNHYDFCRNYLFSQIDWDSKSAEIAENGVIWFDITGVIGLFPHLELDENYDLICYLSSEYHGLWGRVAALHRGALRTPVIDSELEWLSRLFHGKQFKLPEAAVFPMEAIYNDATPEGYFEALLCERFLSALPYARYEQELWDVIMTQPPSSLDDRWDSYVSIQDWRPRAIGDERRVNTLLVFQRKIENGIGGSSGRDRIYLTQYSFQSRLGPYHSLSAVNRRAEYRAQIDDDTRYSQTRRCCVSAASSILIAEEKSPPPGRYPGGASQERPERPHISP